MSLALGGPVNLGNTTLMDVRARGGRYWRAATYDQYAGQGWLTTERESQFLDAGDVITRSSLYEARRTITQTYTIYTPEATQLFALNQAERFSLPIKATVLETETEDGSTQIASMSMASSRYSLNSGDSYIVVSSIPSAEEDAMRLAGEDYPDWIDHYLQLPDTLPQRVRDLAEELTAEYDNAYDKASALQDYARTLTYNDQVQAPPEGVDPVDYFLFESQEGYCNYYASAMAVMARSVGIPARIAAGYSQGDWERDAQAYRVRQHHSHAWVEVYFPRFGWVEFEPTAAEPVIVRPRVAGGGSGDNRAGEGGFGGPEDFLDEEQYGPDSVTDPEALARLIEEQRRMARIRTWTRIGGVAGVALLIIVIAWFLGRREMDQVRPASVYYERMVRRGSRWGCRTMPTQTPNEYARQLSTAIQDVEADRLVHRIAHAYVGERYGHKNPARWQPDFAWRDLRSILVRWGIAHRWKRLWGRA
jgi:transglutaminase-like putative cysteine protease